MVDVDGKEERLDFAYRPNAYTPEHERASKEVRKEELGGEVLINLLIPVLDWVDLIGDDGKRIAIEPEALRTVPLNILNDLVGKINEDMDPGKQKNSASRGSFKA
jgi:hypothetical protein